MGWMPDERTRLEDYLDWWLDFHVERRMEPRTVVSYRQISRDHIVPHLGERRLSELTMLIVQDWIDSFEETKYASATVALFKTVFASAIEYAVGLGIMERNVVRPATAPVITRVNHFRAMNRDESARFLHAAEGEWYGPLLTTALLTGMRLSELRGLRWPNVHDSHIYICESVAPKGKVPRWSDRTKGGHDRSVPVPPMLRDLLAEHRMRIARRALQVGTRDWGGYDLVFPTREGNCPAPSMIAREARKISEKADISPLIRPHELRHTYATRLAEEGLQIVTIQKLLGHKNYDLTARTYVHLTDHTRRSAVEAIERSFLSE